MKILITGGLGYAGSVLSKYLSKQNNIYIIDKVLFNNSQYKKIKNKNITLHKFDILNSNKVEKIFKSNNIDLVIHLAAIVGDPASKAQPELTKQINLIASKKVFSLAKKYSVKKFIFFSTCSNYGLSYYKKLLKETSPLKPLSMYAKTKVDFEKFLLKDKSKIKKIILRLSTLYGLSFRMRFDLTVNEFLKKMYFKEKLDVYHKDTFRPYLSLDDLKIIVEKLINYKFRKNSIVFNVGFNKENLSKKSIVEKVSKQLSFKSKYNYIDREHFDRRNYRVDFSKIKKIGIKQKFNFNYNIRKMLSYLKKTTKKVTNKKIFYNHR